MQHEVTNGRDPICNMKLPMVGTLCVTRDPICNGTSPRPLEWVAKDLLRNKKDCLLFFRQLKFC